MEMLDLRLSNNKLNSISFAKSYHRTKFLFSIAFSGRRNSRDFICLDKRKEHMSFHRNQRSSNRVSAVHSLMSTKKINNKMKWNQILKELSE